MQPTLPSITEVANTGTFGLKLPALPRHPFVGLRPFNSDEALLFFGRSEQTIDLLQQLHRTHFVAIVGSSGCGKSSLVRAGLIPKLQAGFLVEERDQWLVATMKPGDAPLDNLAESLLGAATPDSTGAWRKNLTAAVRAGGVAAIIERLERALDDSDANLLLLVDQFEELFPFGVESGKAENRAEALRFVEMMLALSEQRRAPIYVVMTMRSDFLGDCDNFRGLPEAMNRSQYLVPRLTREQLRQAVEGPANLFGGSISSRLLDLVLDDVGDKSDQLPVMQHALMRTWERWEFENARSGAPRIDVEHYKATGEIKDALSKDAEAALAGMSDEDLKVTKQLFQALTGTDANNRRVRRPAHLSEIAAITGAGRENILDIIERFREGGRSFLSLTDDDDPLIDISHESLIRQWERLREWVDGEAESCRIYLSVADAAKLYEKYDKKEDLLWRGTQLQLALAWQDERRPNRAWARRNHPGVDRTTADQLFDRAMWFLAESEKARDVEARANKRRQRRRRITAGFVGVVITGLAVYLGILSWSLNEQALQLLAARERSESNRRLAEAAQRHAESQREIAETEKRNADRQSQLAADAQLQAEEKSREAEEQRRLALARQLAAQSEAALDNSGEGLARSFLLAAGSLRTEWTLEGYEAAAKGLNLLPRRLAVRPTHRDEVRALTLSRGGRWLATQGRDGTVIVQETASGKEVIRLSGNGGFSYSALAFDPQGQWLVAGDGHEALVWETATWKMVKRLRNGDMVWSAAFSPDSRLLATASYHSQAVRIYQTDNWNELDPIEHKEFQALAVAFHPGGGQLVTSGMDTVRMWDPASRKLLGQMDIRQCWALAFSSNGEFLATGGSDGTVNLWRMTFRVDGTVEFRKESDENRQRIDHNAKMLTIAFSPYGHFLLTGAMDGTARVWSVRTGREVTRITGLGKTRGFVPAVFDPDGSAIFTGDTDGAIRQWDGLDKSVYRLQHGAAVKALAFSPNGKWLATASDDHIARVFDSGAWREVAQKKHRDQVTAVAFSPGGRWWIIVGRDTVWVFETGAWRDVVHMEQKERAITRVTLSPNGKWLSVWAKPASENFTANPEKRTVYQTVWEIATGQQIASAIQEYERAGSYRSSTYHKVRDTSEGITKEADAWQDVRMQMTSQNSPDGRLKASSFSGEITLFDAATGRVVNTIYHYSVVNDLAFSPNGRWVATASVDGKVRLWPLSSEDIIREACARLPRNLSQEEWKMFLGDKTNYRETCPGLPAPEK